MPHDPRDVDPAFNGDSAAHWEGDTPVVDVTGIDTRLRNTVPVEAAGGRSRRPFAVQKGGERGLPQEK